MHDLTMTISGKPKASKETFPVLNPANGQLIAHAPECTPELLDAAVTSANEAREPWLADSAARSSALLEIAARVEGNLEKLAALITEEQGKPLHEAKDELGGAVGDLRYYAELNVPVDTVADTDDLVVQVLRRPIGAIAAITPWNFPLGTAMSKLAPALAAGCTVVLKPSPYTPLSSLRFGELVRDALPPGVLNVVSGSDSLGSLMTSHPLVRMISFTGSVATGKKIAMTAAADVKRVLLELGGNDPAIVLDDADVDATATACLRTRSQTAVRSVWLSSGYTRPKHSTASLSTPWLTARGQRGLEMGRILELTSARCAIRHSATVSGKLSATHANPGSG